MNTFLEMQTAVQSDLTIGSESTLYPPATVKLAINRAYRKAGNLYDWPELEDAKKTSTLNGYEYYDYPQEWKPDSIWKLTVDGEDYGDPLVFKDYLYEKEEEFPSGLEKAWSTQWRRFFIYPTPTTNGTNNICVWGRTTVETLENDADVTIFSYAQPECNEAIVLEAVSILKYKGEEEKSGDFRSIEAAQLLTNAWMRVQKSQKKYEHTTPFFDVPDFFQIGSTARTRTGNF